MGKACKMTNKEKKVTMRGNPFVGATTSSMAGHKAQGASTEIAHLRMRLIL